MRNSSHEACHSRGASTLPGPAFWLLPRLGSAAAPLPGVRAGGKTRACLPGLRCLAAGVPPLHLGMKRNGALTAPPACQQHVRGNHHQHHVPGDSVQGDQEQPPAQGARGRVLRAVSASGTQHTRAPLQAWHGLHTAGWPGAFQGPQRLNSKQLLLWARAAAAVDSAGRPYTVRLSLHLPGA